MAKLLKYKKVKFCNPYPNKKEKEKKKVFGQPYTYR